MARGSSCRWCQDRTSTPCLSHPRCQIQQGADQPGVRPSTYEVCQAASDDAKPLVIGLNIVDAKVQRRRQRKVVRAWGMGCSRMRQKGAQARSEGRDLRQAAFIVAMAALAVIFVNCTTKATADLAHAGKSTGASMAKHRSSKETREMSESSVLPQVPLNEDSQVRILDPLELGSLKQFRVPAGPRPRKQPWSIARPVVDANPHALRVAADPDIFVIPEFVSVERVDAILGTAASIHDQRDQKPTWCFATETWGTTVPGTAEGEGSYIDPLHRTCTSDQEAAMRFAEHGDQGGRSPYWSKSANVNAGISPTLDDLSGRVEAEIGLPSAFGQHWQVLEYDSVDGGQLSAHTDCQVSTPAFDRGGRCSSS